MSLILPPFPPDIHYPLAGRHPITNGWLYLYTNCIGNVSLYTVRHI